MKTKNGLIKILPAFLLILTVVFLTGCADKNKPFNGNFSAYFTYGDIIDSRQRETYLSDGREALTKVEITQYLDFSEDGTFRYYFDEEAMRAGMDRAVEGSMEAYLVGKWTEEGVTEEEFDDVARGAGFEDFDDLLAHAKDDAKKAMAEVSLNSDLKGTYEVTEEEYILHFENGSDGSAKRIDGNVLINMGNKEVLFTPRQ